ncbi:hypothetical protein DM860_000983 [Cuscuta australis]|uniref:Ribosomal RNA-processing protein 12-like conserved domain-containing protein n=1 Tax=Cuscuta australis TaxID=267555 RepID=A0A328DX34_9ASTE|nr:hypothetical protein DM860_000983 [Cuscuta australis]
MAFYLSRSSFWIIFLDLLCRSSSSIFCANHLSRSFVPIIFLDLLCCKLGAPIFPRSIICVDLPSELIHWLLFAMAFVSPICFGLQSNNEGRKAAYDVLTGICSYMQNSLSEMSLESYKNFITMVMGYLSGPPQIKSGAISALSVLIYNDSDICQLVPDLVPSVLALLKSKSLEVIKAVLGFVKVLVSCLQSTNLNLFLPDIVNGVLPWTATSRHHFRSKVSVVMEILARKCGTDTIKSIAPEKYTDFLQSLTENRYRKKSVKETAASTSLKCGGCGDSGIVQNSKKRKWQRRQNDVTGKHHNGDEGSSIGPKRRKKAAADHSTSRKWAYTGGSTPTQSAERRGKPSSGKPGKRKSEDKNPSKQKGGAKRAGHKTVQKKHGSKMN